MTWYRRLSVLTVVVLCAAAPALVPPTPAQAGEPTTLAVDGTLSVVAVDSFAAGRADHLYSVVTDSGAQIPVELEGDVPANARFSGELVVEGAVAAALDERDLLPRAGATITEDSRAGRVATAVAEQQRAPLTVAESSLTAVAAAAPTPAAHRVYVAVLDNRGSVEETDTDVQTYVDGITGYWTTESSGVITSFAIQGAVQHFSTSTSTTVSSTADSCGMKSPEAIWNEAATRFPGVSFSTSSRNHLVVAMADECSDGGIAGVASVGNDFSSGGRLSFSMGSIASQVGVHEVGHTFGLGHANLDRCPAPRTSIDYCGDGEYFDLYSPMALAVSGGSSTFSPPALDSAYRLRLGVAAADEVSTETLSGGAWTRTLTLRPRSSASGLRGLEVVDPTTNVTYVVELRSGTARDASTFYAGSSSLRDVDVVYGRGVTVTTVAPASGDLTLFPRTDNIPYQGARVAGQVFTSPSGSVRVSVDALTSTSATVTLSFPNAPTIASATPTISGVAAAGQTVTAAPGAWGSGATFTYDWVLDGVSTGSTGSTYTIPASAQGRALSVRVTGSKNGTKPATASSGAVTVAAAPPPLAAGFPVVNGTVAVGSTVSVDPGTWETGATLTYDWRVGGVSTGATAPSFVIPASAAGKTLDVVVTGSKDGFSSVRRQSAAQAVALGTFWPGLATSGPGGVGTVVSASVSDWPSDAVLTYQWVADDVPVAGATSRSFAVPEALFGANLRVVVTGSRQGYAPASASSAARVVTAGQLRTTIPTISGTARVGKTLKAKVGTWTPRPSFRYQWFANGRTITSRGTKSSFKLTAKEKGKTITVRVTGTKLAYTTVSKTSKKTKKVAAR